MYAWFYYWDLYSAPLIYLSLLSSVLNRLDYSRSGSNSPLNLLFSFNIILDHINNHKYFVAQLLSYVQLFATPWSAAQHASLSFTISWSLLKLMSISQWCHQTILSSVVPFSYTQSFLASGSFLMSQLFTSGGQSIELQLQHQSFQWLLRVKFL